MEKENLEPIFGEKRLPHERKKGTKNGGVNSSFAKIGEPLRHQRGLIDSSDGKKKRGPEKNSREPHKKRCAQRRLGHKKRLLTEEGEGIQLKRE